MGSGEEQSCKFYLYPTVEEKRWGWCVCGGGALPAASPISSPVSVFFYRRPHLPSPGGEGRVGVEHSGLVHTPQPPFPRQPREPRSFSSLSSPAGVSAAAGGGGGGRGEEGSAAQRCGAADGRAAAAARESCGGGGGRHPPHTHTPPPAPRAARTPRRRQNCRAEPRRRSRPPRHRAGVTALQQFPLWFSVREGGVGDRALF